MSLKTNESSVHGALESFLCGREEHVDVDGVLVRPLLRTRTSRYVPGVSSSGTELA